METDGKCQPISPFAVSFTTAYNYSMVLLFLLFGIQGKRECLARSIFIILLHFVPICLLGYPRMRAAYLFFQVIAWLLVF